MRSLFTLIVLSILLTCCSTVKDIPKYRLATGVYRFREGDSAFRKAYVYVNEDTIAAFENNDINRPLITDPEKNKTFVKRSFDIDVMTIGLKYRPATGGLPRQITTDFSGNLYVGYRLDRFKLRIDKTPIGLSKTYYHGAITMGAFGGIGSSDITPSTTKYSITDEYHGLILSRGLALMLGVNNLTVGLGVGWDYLTDRDKDVWIYQNKPWYGLTIGLNIN